MNGDFFTTSVVKELLTAKAFITLWSCTMSKECIDVIEIFSNF